MESFQVVIGCFQTKTFFFPNKRHNQDKYEPFKLRHTKKHSTDDIHEGNRMKK